jgi:hypothetical protein
MIYTPRQKERFFIAFITLNREIVSGVEVKTFVVTIKENNIAGIAEVLKFVSMTR